ncbi:hypothetical protein BT96DRAFT_933910 [Gymnopus androsaceus JB14]|uniref:Uncharacterized protein n=1 Tax=Gymnopus androsaceus JB14 TaxID=1447944 RepID=A0A6A4ID40_9AGAR|nr:hypothetical protein BT96DRAFT_933910 [Gymnopus androsaceus JB14]
MNLHHPLGLSPLSSPPPSPSPSTAPVPFYPDGTPSPISLPEVRLSKYTRPTFFQPFSDWPSESPDALSLPTAPQSEPSSPLSPVLETRRIPRSPNAFMLFRSNMLKTGAIPAAAEKRQQQLSKRSRSGTTRRRDNRSNIQLKYPGYKFTPAARGSSRKAKKAQSAEEDKVRIRELREKWTEVYGPAASPRRRRKPKQKEHSLPRNEPEAEADSLLPTLSFTSSPSPSSPSSSSGGDSSLPPMFPNPSYPHYPGNQPLNFEYNSGAANEYPLLRPPSASSNPSLDGHFDYSAMFFDEHMGSSSPSSSAPHSPSSDNGLSAGFNKFNITPTAASFNDNDIHSPPNPLRQAPPFTALTQKIPYEPPFLSPLVPSTSDLANSFPEQHTAEGAPSGPYSTSLASNFAYKSAKFDELDLGSLESILSLDTAFLDYSNIWNFTGDGGFDHSLV